MKPAKARPQRASESRTTPRGADPLERIARIRDEVVACRKCPRLVVYREAVACTKVRRFREQTYWGRPLPGFGDPQARLLIVGLAPAANGGNRTGRIFTGDPSGDWLYRALHKAGFANQPTSVSRDDGLAVTDCYINAAARCAPPDNKPLPQEYANCRGYLVREMEALQRLRCIVALGAHAMTAVIAAWRERGYAVPRGLKFGHGVEHELAGGVRLIASYHPSQRNTQTGLLKEPMFDAIFAAARRCIANG